MNLTKMNVTGQLDERGAERFAARIGTSYVIAAIAALIGAIGVFVHAIRWW